MSLTVQALLAVDQIAPAPKLDVPFLSAFRVTHGPPGLLARFFAFADTELRQRGLSLSFATFEEVAKTHKKNVENWGLLNPMFDPDISDIPTAGSFCVVVRDPSGEIVGTGAGKRFVAENRSFRDIIDRGDFFSIRPDRNPFNLMTRTNNPIADTLRGQLGYCGGIWVHPNHRGFRLPAMLGRLVNACIITLWNSNFVLGFVRNEFEGTDYHKRYGFKHDAPSFEMLLDGKVVDEAVLLWMTAEDAAVDIARFVDVVWPQIDAAVVARGRKQSA